MCLFLFRQSPLIQCNDVHSGIRDPLRLLICVPTYNEAENIAPFLDEVIANAPPDAHILVIADNSPDGTAGIVTAMREKYGEKLGLLERHGKQDGASAFLQAFD
ncbi:MAG: hypothetical protein Pg6C_16140 [Treponemataceae bacterium]|nr:MAG: hypothetical protein Pg6C_16140 [Treponemataceae bacterium]